MDIELDPVHAVPQRALKRLKGVFRVLGGRTTVGIDPHSGLASEAAGPPATLTQYVSIFIIRDAVCSGRGEYDIAFLGTTLCDQRGGAAR